MYFLLTPMETVEISSHFELAGTFIEGVQVWPKQPAVMGMKGLPLNEHCPPYVSQQCLYISWEPDSKHPLDASRLFKHEGKYFAEMKYACPLGAVSLHVFLLVPASKCSFIYRGTESDMAGAISRQLLR